MTYDFNEFNFQFTFKIKPIVENQIKKSNVDCGWKPVTDMYNCSYTTATEIALQVPSTSGDAKNQ